MNYVFGDQTDKQDSVQQCAVAGRPMQVYCDWKNNFWHMANLSFSITWRSRKVGIALLYFPFLDNYQLYSGFERSFIVWLHLSATTLIILLCNLSHLWCSGGKTFSFGNWKDHCDWAFCVAFICFAVAHTEFKTGEFFPDVFERLDRSLGSLQ